MIPSGDIIPKAEVIIYTDGACNPNPGAGGWAAILTHKKDGQTHTRELMGSDKQTTNNRMEIMAVIEGLKAIKRPCSVLIYSDSKYVVNSIGSWNDGRPVPEKQGWVIGWQEKGWRSANGPSSNVDLWEAILTEVKRHKSVIMSWVAGHGDNEFNNKCDALAVAARKAVLNDYLPVCGLPSERITDNPDETRTPINGKLQSIKPPRPRNRKRRKSKSYSRRKK